MKKLLGLVLVLTLTSFSYGQVEKNPLSDHLQDVSVTIKAAGSEGSGVIITRKIKNGDKEENVNFIWTAGHVIDSLRSTREIIVDGSKKQIVEFRDPQIVKEETQNGRKIGEYKMDCKVLKYSHAENGEDLALLMVRKIGFSESNTRFYLDDNMIVPIGTQLYHVGSLLGQGGANSMTTGIMSQVGRVLQLGSGDGVIFDQTTVTAFPGSSGGGVFLATGKNSGLYIGMLVRGAGETFNLVVPIRRMNSWAKKVDIEWALNEKLNPPSMEDILKMQIEGVSTKQNQEKVKTPDVMKYPTLIELNKIKNESRRNQENN